MIGTQMMTAIAVASLVLAGCGGASAPERGRADNSGLSPSLAGSEADMATTVMGFIPSEPQGIPGEEHWHRGWGYWGIAGDDILFWASASERTVMVAGAPFQDVHIDISGPRNFANPAASATWTGDVTGVDQQYRHSSGAAMIAFDLHAVSVDVTFSEFSDGRGDMEWRGLAVSQGAFAEAGIAGAFYGPTHQGAAGAFRRDGLRGMFGALRQ